MIVGTRSMQIDAPFVGTRPFEIGEPIFGRSREINELSNRLLARRIVLLHGLSGAGKTSLIRAGLMPRLQGDFQILPVIRLNKRPPPDWPHNRYLYSFFDSLGERLPPSTNTVDLANLLEKIREAIIIAGDPAARRTLLVLDQFEELLALDRANPEEKQAFLAQLLPVLLDTRYWIIFSMREDYLADLEAFLAFFPDRLTARVRLEFLKHEAAVEALREPVNRFSVNFHLDAAEELVRDLRQVLAWRQGGIERKTGLYVEPMHLQVVGLNLWEANRPDDSQITLQDVAVWGDVEDALQAYYERQITPVAQLSGKRELDLRDWIEYSLITDQGLRGTVREGQETEYDLDADAVRMLIDRHLVRREERLETVWYELAHDRLVEPIRNANTAWRKKLNPLQIHARPWVRQGKPQHLLLSSPAFIEAEAWARTRAETLEPVEREYLDASRTALGLQRADRAIRAERGINLEEVGWGVIFAADADPAVRDALRELLDHRRAQATQLRSNYYVEFWGEKGYRAGETAQKFLIRSGAGYGQATPDRVPYYLLIVGDPREIPFEFQYDLDIQYAVGRISFDTLEEYQSYARSVVFSENSGMRLPNRAVILGTAHENDTGTRLSYQHLVRPLAHSLQQLKPNWRVNLLPPEEATKTNLSGLLGGKETPTLLFTATHGNALTSGDPLQGRYQGALVTQDWPGPSAQRGLARHEYYAGEDISDEARLLGMFAFLWGAFSAGTPQYSETARYGDRDKEALAPYPLIATLPKRLLGHPRGGALAVIGLVERGWTASFLTAEGIGDLSSFETTLYWLMQGRTAGKAMEEFNKRYSMLNALLSEELRAYYFQGKQNDRVALEKLLTQMLHARSYLLLGDPAVRLPIEPDNRYEAPHDDWIHPAIEAVQPTVVKIRAVKATAPEPPLPETEKASVPAEAPAAQQEDVLMFNGINGESGTYDLPPMKIEDLSAFIRAERAPENLSELRFRFQQRASRHF